MTIANLKIGKQNFVVVPERDFERLQRESKMYHQLQQRHAKEDAADLAEAQRRLKDPKRKTIPLARLKAELGL